MSVDPLEPIQGKEVVVEQATPSIRIAPEQIQDDQIEGVIHEVRGNLSINSVMESLSKNHQFNLRTITRSEIVRGEVVLHCNNLYEYLKTALPEPEEKALIDKNRSILEKLSSNDQAVLVEAMSELETHPDQEWIKDRMNFEGSAMNIQGRDQKIVIMVDIPIRQLYTRGEDGKGRLRTAEEQQKRSIDYRHTVEHEVQHVKFYNERGRHVQQVLEDRKEKGSLSVDEEEYLMIEFLTKDEVLAHVYNQLNPDGTIDWEGIKQNLRKPDYAKYIAISENIQRYERTLDELVDQVREIFAQQGIDANPDAEGFDLAMEEVMEKLIQYKPKEYPEMVLS